MESVYNQDVFSGIFSQGLTASSEIELLLALNPAIVSFHRARSQQVVLQILREQFQELGLCAVVALRDREDDALYIRAVVVPPAADRQEFTCDALKQRQDLVLHTENEFVKEVLQLRQARLVMERSDVLDQLIPHGLQELLAVVLEDWYLLPTGFVSIALNGTLFGVLGILAVGLSEEHMPIFQAFAQQLAVALRNTQNLMQMIQTEKGLRDLQEFHESIVENLQEGVVVVHADGRFIFANPAVHHMLGLLPNSLEGKLWSAVVPTDQQEVIRQASERQQQGVFDRYELSLLNARGSRTPVLVSASPLLHNGEIMGTLMVLTDIKERKRMEQALELQIQAERQQLLLSRTLQEVSGLLTSQQGLQDVLESILGMLRRVVNYDSAAVLLLTPDGALEFAAGRGFTDLEQVRQSIGSTSGRNAMASSIKGRPLMIPDTRADSRWVVLPGTEHVRSWIGVPLLVKNEFIGALTVDSHTPNTYGEQAIETVAAFANQAAVAIENARLFEAEHKARERAEALQEAAYILSTTLTLDDVLMMVLNQLSRVLPFDSSSIMLVEDEYAVPKIWQGYPDGGTSTSFASIRYNVKLDPTVGAVIRKGQPIIIPDVHADPRWVDTPFNQHVCSWMGIPLWFRDQVIGLFNLDRKATRGFNDTDISLAQSFALHASAAIQNARLLEDEEQRTAELLAVRQATLSLTASLEPAEVLDGILENTLRFIPGSQNANIYLYHVDEMGDRLIFGAALWRDGRSSAPMVEPRQNGLTYTVARTGSTMIVPDMAESPLFSSPSAEVSWKGAIIGLPLNIGQRVLGVMNISYPQPHSFSDAEQRVLGLLADHAAIAIQNADLYERAATERRHLSLLYALGRRLANSLDFDDILSQAITLTCEVLGGLVGEAFLYVPESDALSLRALYPQEHYVDIAQSFQLDIGKGLAGWVAQTRVAENVPDVSKDTHWQPVQGLDDGVSSGIIAPILEENRLLGVILVLHKELAAFSKDHLDLLVAICQQVGLALINAERYQQVQSLVDQLEAEQRRLESLVERLPVGILLLDVQRQVLVANLLGRQILEALNGEFPGGRLEQIGSCPLDEIMEQRADSLPVEIIGKGPPAVVVEADARMIGEEAQQWVITLRDVTQERQNQERIQMQERLATVGQLAAGIAHDFNNIMAAIMVYTDLLMAEHGLPDSVLERLGIIQQQVQRAASLIRQILDFSRRSVIEQSPMDLLPFIKELNKLLVRVLPETIRVISSFQPGDYIVRADPTRLQQVFMNLALNARDAMPDGGELRFLMNRVRLREGDFPPHRDLHEGEWICIQVEDTGCGIPEEFHSRIFDPFFTTKPVGQGTGLGLAQVYGIVKQHGGHIDVKSKMGRGTQFIIYLEAVSPTQDLTVVEEDPLSLDGQGARVLVVEDDISTRQALNELLKAFNFEAMMASNGIGALQLFEQYEDTIKMVISDVVMPQMGGIELSQTLLERWPQVKVLFVTGHPLDQENQDVLQTGQVSWLQKPFSARDFCRAIRQLLKT